MDLAKHQRVLLGLIRSTYQVRADDDAYFQRVAASKDLEEARGNVLLWRVYVLERTCVLTVELLRQRQLLVPVLQDFIRQQNISPFREFQPRAFLAFLASKEDHLVVSVSQFELALMRVREGDPRCFVVYWQVDPRAVLKDLADGHPLDVCLPTEPHWTRISGDLPGLFEIEPSRQRAIADTRPTERQDGIDPRVGGRVVQH